MSDLRREIEAVLSGEKRWTVIHGDCLDVLPLIPAGAVDAVVTDPPYGIKYVGSPGTSNKKNLGPNAMYKGKRPLRTRETVVADERTFDPSPWMQWPCAMWGVQHFYHTLPAGGSIHSWDKRGDYERITFADADFVWINRKRNAQTFRLVWRGLCRHSENTERILHPTQKPIAVMKWVFDLLDVREGALIIDPFCGSGTTGVACIETGRRFIGIEIDKDYCRIARNRIEQTSPYLFAQEA